MRTTFGALLRPLCSLAIAMALGATTTPASAADACISPKARSVVEDCPGGNVVAPTGKKSQPTFKSAPAAISLKQRGDQTLPTNPTASMNAAQRDQRNAVIKPKIVKLLITEIQGLESLFTSTPKNAPDRPKLMR